MPRSTFRSLILAAALVCAGPGIAQSQSIHPVDLDGETVNFLIPEGYCLIETDRPREKVMFELMDKNLGPGNELIFWFVRCDLLEMVRLGFTETLFEDYGLYFAVVEPDGAFVHIDYVSRAALAEASHKQVPLLDIRQMAANSTQRARETLLDPNASIELFEFGTTGFNNDAVFLTLSGAARLHEVQLPVAGGGGSTLINRRLVNVMLYLITDEPDALVRLDASSRRLVADWLAANPDSDN